MRWSRSVLPGLFMAVPAVHLAAQPPASPESTRSHKSVYGKLQRIDESLSAVFMDSDDGQRLVWRLDKAVVSAAARFKVGEPMIVVYRQLTPTEKRVTALAFPGTATVPTYVNMTGSSVVLRSAPAVGGECAQLGGPATDTPISTKGQVEIANGCWCCASAGESCTPANKTGLGQALLVYCFK
jgi:hypothetical protein